MAEQCLIIDTIWETLLFTVLLRCSSKWLLENCSTWKLIYIVEYFVLTMRVIHYEIIQRNDSIVLLADLKILN